MYDLVLEMKKQFENYPEVKVMGYGHLGDGNLSHPKSIFFFSVTPQIGNLHLNVNAPKHEQKYLSIIEPFVYEYTGASFHKGRLTSSLLGDHSFPSEPPRQCERRARHWCDEAESLALQ